MQALGIILALLLIGGVLLDGFETIVLPRRISQLARFSSLFYRATWAPWRALARRMSSAGRREVFLGVYGPLSLILLLALWAAILVLGFALLQWSIGTQLNTPEGTVDFPVHLYMSATAFTTLGLGDVSPTSYPGRLLVTLEAGLGLAFLGTVIGYLPALSSAFSQREVRVSLLDERAGSPPSAIELLRRHNRETDTTGIEQMLHDWEHWSAELLESHLSYPVLGFYRSQHLNESWIAALGVILDTSAVVITGIKGVPTRQAQLTFAMARHAAVDLLTVYRLKPNEDIPDRLPPRELALLRTTLGAAGLDLREGDEADSQLAALRAMYEPQMIALSEHLLMALPAWIPPAGIPDAWQAEEEES